MLLTLSLGFDESLHIILTGSVCQSCHSYRIAFDMVDSHEFVWLYSLNLKEQGEEAMYDLAVNT